jgi:hypothetical protein
MIRRPRPPAIELQAPYEVPFLYITLTLHLDVIKCKKGLPYFPHLRPKLESKLTLPLLFGRKD